MLDKTAADKFNAVPLSNDTVSRRVDFVATDIIDQVVAKLTGSFALQLDESTDVSGSAQLVGFVKYRDADDIAKHILFCKNMQGRTTGKDIFNASAFFAEKSLNWTRCSSICTDAAASMTGTIKSFVTLAKDPNVKWTHCIIHRAALASKRMSPQLHDILNCSIKVINFIKSRPLNSRLFRLFCEKMETEHTQLLLHTEVRWLSRGRILNRLFKLRTEVGMFCKEHNSPYSELFENVGWLAKLCYLAEIFDKLDEVNVGLQGKGTNILILHDKISVFLKKIDLWKKTCQKADFTCFLQLQKFIFTKKVEIEIIKAMIDDRSFDKSMSKLSPILS